MGAAWDGVRVRVRVGGCARQSGSCIKLKKRDVGVYAGGVVACSMPVSRVKAYYVHTYNDLTD